MFIVIIKGSARDAHRAAANRAVPLRVVGTLTGAEHVSGRVGDQHEPKLMRWFCEDQGPAPFPPGSLLFYNRALAL